MTLLTAPEKTRSAAAVAALIEASGLTATLLRRTGPESRYGEEDSEYADTGITFPFELHPKSKDTIGEDTHDAEIHILPSLDLHEEDRVAFNAETYKVLNVVEENLFGAITHKVARLARVYDAD